MGMKKRAKVSAEFSMSSLTDIIFLLLIFFMLTSSMVVPNALNLKLPGQSKNPPSNQPKNPPSTVTVNRNGTYLLNNAKTTKSGIEKDVRAQLKRTKKVSIVIVPHDDAPHESVGYLLDLAYRYKIDAILTDPK